MWQWHEVALLLYLEFETKLVLMLHLSWQVVWTSSQFSFISDIRLHEHVQLFFFIPYSRSYGNVFSSSENFIFVIQDTGQVQL